MDSSLTSNLLGKFRPISDSQNQQQLDTLSLHSLNYKSNQHNPLELATRFLFECGVKLKVKPTTSAAAAQIYHKFFEAASESTYDPYLIAATALYIASKQQDDPLKIRDLINVAHRTLNRDADVLDLSDEYWNFRDSIVQAELLTMRMIGFKSIDPHVHLYLLTYLKTLESWILPNMWEKAPLAKLCWTLLQDFHHSKAVIQYEPQVIALAIIYMGLQVYGITVPCTTEQDQPSWHEVLFKGAKLEYIWSVIDNLLSLYENDKELS